MAHEYSPVEYGVAPVGSDERKTKDRERPRLYVRWFEDGWGFEIISTVFGIALIVALCLVLRSYDGEPVPSFGSVLSTSITLNTVVSILISLAIPALLLSVGESIGQLKWMWYSDRDRSLEDLISFDKASRGVLGGAKFLWKLRARPIASLGAVLMIVQLAIGPLAQNGLQYPSEPTSFADSPDALAPIARQHREGGQQLQIQSNLGLIPYGYNHMSLGMKGAIQRGLFSTSAIVDPSSPTCVSGNCTIGPYRSLAVCASAADITSSLTRSIVDTPQNSAKNATRYSLPGDHYLQIDENTLVILNFSSAAISPSGITDNEELLPLNFNDSLVFSNVSLPIADVYFIYLDTNVSGSVDNNYHAIEFVLEWCVQTFETSVENGTPNTMKRDSFRSFEGSGRSSFTATPDPSKQNDYYEIDPYTHYSLQRYMLNLLHGNVTESFSNVGSTTSSDAANALFEPFLDLSSGTPPLDGLQNILDNIATGMTNELRSNVITDPFRGTLIRHITVVRVQWGYVVAPIVFMILCVLFFFGTLLYGSLASRRTDTWKSSIIPVLHVSGFDTKEVLGGMTSLSVMMDHAAGTTVRLVRQGSSGWRLISEDNAAS
ncbi:hypothetical protein BJ170DRAFT_681805 [Xylariales sp. AK1849]|nr:hypothetical protein BJ170DRAFT_681805 [Xylariales sp. AK1849]